MQRKHLSNVVINTMLNAAENDDAHYFITELVAKRRIDHPEVNSKNSQGYSPLALACSLGHFEIVYILLLGHYVDLNQPNNESWTPLMLAAFYGHQYAAKLLIKDLRCNVNARDEIGGTALMYAAFHGRHLIVQTLIASGKADVNAQDNEGWTALMYAVYGGHFHTATLLLASADTNLFLENNLGENVEDIALSENNAELIHLIQSAIRLKKHEILLAAVAKADVDVIDLQLADRPEYVALANQQGETAIQAATTLVEQALDNVSLAVSRQSASSAVPLPESIFAELNRRLAVMYRCMAAISRSGVVITNQNKVTDLFKQAHYFFSFAGNDAVPHVAASMQSHSQARSSRSW